MAPQNDTTLSGTHLHLGGMKQRGVNFSLKEISSVWPLFLKLGGSYLVSLNISAAIRDRTRDLWISSPVCYHWVISLTCRYRKALSQLIQNYTDKVEIKLIFVMCLDIWPLEDSSQNCVQKHWKSTHPLWRKQQAAWYAKIYTMY